MIGDWRKGWEWLEIPRMCFDRPGIRRNKRKLTGFGPVSFWDHKGSFTSLGGAASFSYTLIYR